MKLSWIWIWAPTSMTMRFIAVRFASSISAEIWKIASLSIFSSASATAAGCSALKAANLSPVARTAFASLASFSAFRCSSRRRPAFSRNHSWYRASNCSPVSVVPAWSRVDSLPSSSLGARTSDAVGSEAGVGMAGGTPEGREGGLAKSNRAVEGVVNGLVCAASKFWPWG